ncbi:MULTISPECIES: hypothetical protein [Calothrix]|uniref:Transposase n=2 Tax=Calothrix TaxID=1186 RepID=A0ABR8AFV2_9CYAN|nr:MULTISPECIES: hypothetical protein [Calothrix]MBD2198811.1 hypothetical protein [Calothrix parietina FACHB-288]MBD2227151.1 hypothetical protein [Calothrix anomala FACHB-343]
MQRIYNHVIIAAHLSNCQPKKFGIISTETKAINFCNQKNDRTLENICFTTGDRILQIWVKSQNMAIV